MGWKEYREERMKDPVWRAKHESEVAALLAENEAILAAERAAMTERSKAQIREFWVRDAAEKKKAAKAAKTVNSAAGSILHRDSTRADQAGGGRRKRA